MHKQTTSTCIKDRYYLKVECMIYKEELSKWRMKNKLIFVCKEQDLPIHYRWSMANIKCQFCIAFPNVKSSDITKWKDILGVTFKTLTDSLKALEEDGLVNRKEYPQVPPKAEYSLTEKGRSLIPMLTALCTWGEEHRN